MEFEFEPGVGRSLTRDMLWLPGEPYAVSRVGLAKHGIPVVAVLLWLLASPYAPIGAAAESSTCAIAVRIIGARSYVCVKAIDRA